MNNIDRLLAQLNNSGLQRDNPTLYQVIAQLIKAVKTVLETEDTSSSGSSITNITEQTFIIEDSGGSGGGDGEIGPPGIQGIKGDTGSVGPAGAITIGPMGIDGVDGDDGYPIPGPIGNTGATGAVGPTGPVTIGPMGIDGIDGEDGFPIPGSQGIPGVAGIAGPITIGPMGIDGIDGEDGFPIPGPKGDTGGGGSSTAAWEGKIIACVGDGNPEFALAAIQLGFIGPTPTNITVSEGRVSYFRLKTAITVANIRWYGVGSVVDIYHIAIYRASDNVRLSADHTITTSTHAWGFVADSFTLAADTLYYCVVSADTTGTTVGLAAMGNISSTTLFQIRTLPQDLPGNLDFDNNFNNGMILARVVVTAGVLPDPGNAPTVWPVNRTGGMPAIFLDAA